MVEICFWACGTDLRASSTDAYFFPVPTNSELRRYTVVAAMSFSPLLIAEPCQLRIEAETEDGVIIPGGSLKIRERLPEDPV